MSGADPIVGHRIPRSPDIFSVYRPTNCGVRHRSQRQRGGSTRSPKTHFKSGCPISRANSCSALRSCLSACFPVRVAVRPRLGPRQQPVPRPDGHLQTDGSARGHVQEHYRIRNPTRRFEILVCRADCSSRLLRVSSLTCGYARLGYRYAVGLG